MSDSPPKCPGCTFKMVRKRRSKYFECPNCHTLAARDVTAPAQKAPKVAIEKFATIPLWKVRRAGKAAGMALRRM